MIETSIDFPAGLPFPLRDGRGTNHVSPFSRTTMQSGRARQRRTFTSVPSLASVVWLFENDAHAALFEVWFKEGLKDGAEWFNCPLRTPLGVQPYICRFADMYRGPDADGPRRWRVTAELEIYERPVAPAEYAQYPEYLLDASRFDRTMNKHWPS